MGHFTTDQLRTVIGLHWPYFCVFREPTDRFMSAWRYANQGGGSDGKYYGPKFTSQEECFNYIRTTSIETLDPVFKPQSYYFRMSELDECMCIGAFSTNRLDVLADVISSSFNSKLCLVERNKTKKGSVDEQLFYDISNFVSEYYADDVEIYRRITKTKLGFLQGEYSKRDLLSVT